MKVDFKLESDDVWRAYIKVDPKHIDIDKEDGYKIWVPVATSRRKELCIRNAKARINEIPEHFFDVTR